MNWKRFFALLLVLALLPALFGNAFAAGPKARTLTDADYAPIDALHRMVRTGRSRRRRPWRRQ